MYRTGHSNKAADVPNHHPFNPSIDFKSEADSDKVEVISYSLVYEGIDQCFNSSKIPEDLKQKAQDIRCVVQSVADKEDKEEIVSTLNDVSIIWKNYIQRNEGGAEKRSNTQNGVQSGHGW